VEVRVITEARLRDGTPALILPLMPQDREAVRAGFEELSPESRERRFLASVPHLTERMLDHLVADVDGIDHVALALVVIGDDHTGVPAGIARMIRYPGDPTAADVAVTVHDRWHGRGVATALLAELLRQRPVGVTRIVTTVATDNAAALKMLRRMGPTVEEAVGARIDVAVDLPDELPPATGSGT
jgi:RimJ/RimL family protein N-acetyltransferase